MLADYSLEILIEPLCQWFSQHARQLPWRNDPTPYHVWISEIMLQQTRVEAVKPYYARFMETLPTVNDLAACPEEKYLKLWEGLGYYSRVRNLHEAAVTIMEDYGGEIPGEYHQLLKLKGIGHYTAGAISSIAFGRPAAAVDGNVLRILTRVTGDDTDIMKQAFRKQVEEKLTALLEKTSRHPGMVNQAFMELGATVCLPNGEPHCMECPWHDFCQARLQDSISQLPVKKKAKERRIENRTILLLYKSGDTQTVPGKTVADPSASYEIAIHKRPDKGLLAGLYELPNLPEHLPEERILSYINELGYFCHWMRPLPTARHIFSHVEWNMIGYQIFLEKKENAAVEEAGSGLLFVPVESVTRQYPIPSAFSAYKAFISTF